MNLVPLVERPTLDQLRARFQGGADWMGTFAESLDGTLSEDQQDHLWRLLNQINRSMVDASQVLAEGRPSHVPPLQPIA